MPTGAPPSLIAINHDDYHARHVGHTVGGRQFFMTTPFLPKSDDDEGQEFVALYLFDAERHLLDLGYERAEAIYQNRLQGLGAVTFGRIEVHPFAVDRFGIRFGLLVREPEYEDEDWVVDLHPGNCMAFIEPWDSGDYYT